MMTCTRCQDHNKPVYIGPVFCAGRLLSEYYCGDCWDLLVPNPPGVRDMKLQDRLDNCGTCGALLWHRDEVCASDCSIKDHPIHGR